MMLDIEIRGADEMQAGVTRIADDLHGVPIVDAMRDATMLITRAANKNLVPWQSPEVGGRDTGITAASITPEIRARSNIIEGVVGSNKMSAVVQELGSRKHKAPVEPIKIWARRHGAEWFVVWRAIKTRGTYARRFLGRAFEDNAERVHRIIGKAVGMIISSD